MGEIKEIKKIDVIPFAIFLGILFSLTYIVSIICSFVFRNMIISLNTFDIVFYFFINFTSGYVGGLITATLYNLLSDELGKIKIELE